MHLDREEKKLIQACLAKKRKAQFALYERYKSRMYAVCLRYAKNAAQAQDFLQEGFLKVFQALHQYRFEVPVEYWMKRIMVNACISELRRKKEPLNSSVSFDVQHDTYYEETGETVSTYGLAPGELVGIIQQLPQGYRSIFNLYAIEGYSHDEISQILEISPGTSRSQYARARKALAQSIGQLNKKNHEQR
ncbi:MAG: RNA polymerase sigma factor [Saprospiraceae bacterium]